MLLNKYMNETLSNNVINYFDKLASFASKDNYELGKSDKEIDTTRKIGRYGMNFVDIYNIDISISLNYLIYTKEGHIRQDEIILIHFDKFLFPKYQDVVVANENNIVYYKNKSYVLSISNMLAIIYLEGYSSFVDIINEKYISDQAQKILSEFQNYDLYQIIHYKTKKEEIIVNENIIKKDEKKESSSNFTKFLEDLLNKAPSLITAFLFKPNPKIKEIDEKLKSENISKDIKEKLSKTKKELEENDEKLKNISKKFPKNDLKSDKSSAKIKPNDEILNKLDYKDNEYIKETTNKKINENDKEINSIFKEYDKDSKGNVKNQKNFKSLREKNKDNIDILDVVIYILDNPSTGKDGIETLERSLFAINARFLNSPKALEVTKNVFFTIVEKGLAYIDNKISDYTTGNVLNLSNQYAKELSKISDIDDIVINIEDVDDKNFQNSRPYYIFNKILTDKNHKKSYGKNFLKSRRLLNNILIEFIKKLSKTENDFDGVCYKTKKNILADIILKLNENDAFEYDEFKIFTKFNNLNITKFLIFLFFEKNNFDRSTIKEFSKIYDYDKYVECKSREEDKKIIIEKFKNKETMKNFCSVNKLASIYLFYLNFFDEESVKNNISDTFVVEGAKLSCSFGSASANLIVNDSKEYISGKKKASITDTNMTIFGACSVCKVCKPNIVAPFVNENNILLENNMSLTKNAKAMCSYGGIITIIDTNQNISHTSQMSVKDRKKHDINPIKQDPKIKEIRNKWMELALYEYNDYKGQTETSKNISINGNKGLKYRIEDYHLEGANKKYTSKDPWCMSFVAYIFKKSINFTVQTASTDEFSNKYLNEFKNTDKPYYGSVVYFKKYNNENEYTGHGHVGFVIGTSNDKKYIYCLGGNQSNMIKISRYRVPNFKLKNFKYELVGYYWPKNEQITKQSELTQKDIYEGAINDDCE